MDDSESEMSDAARRFGARLKDRYGKDVYFADERLSTFEATNRTRSQGEPRNDDHAMAAQVIAETWLRELRSR